MANYQVKGVFYPGSEKHVFEKEVDADNEELAQERIYTDLGSKHRVKRTQIEIREVNEA